MTPAPPWRTVWITGASSGIGRGLALSLAADGCKVAVSARSADKLAELATLSPNIRAYPLDVVDATAVADAAAGIERDLGPIDLAVLNAGVLRPMSASRFHLGLAADSFAINYLGVINALDPVMRDMIARGSGHIAIVASVAGYRGLPLSAAYGPTKAALINLAESLYPDLRLKGVKMTIINPGYIATPMTKVNRFPMPYIVTIDEAVAYMRRGLARGQFEIVFPGRMAVVMKMLRVLPYWFYYWLTAKISKHDRPPGSD